MAPLPSPGMTHRPLLLLGAALVLAVAIALAAALDEDLNVNFNERDSVLAAHQDALRARQARQARQQRDAQRQGKEDGRENAAAPGEEPDEREASVSKRLSDIKSRVHSALSGDGAEAVAGSADDDDDDGNSSNNSAHASIMAQVEHEREEQRFASEQRERHFEAYEEERARRNTRSIPEDEDILTEREVLNEKYRALFRKKRSEHIAAVKRIMEMRPKARKTTLETLVNTAFHVLANAKASLQSKYKVGDPVPSDLVVLDGLSTLFENVAFFADLLLRFPDNIHPLVTKNSTRVDLVRWAMAYCNASDVYAPTDRKLLYLMSQELGLIPKDPHYVNPYSKKQQMKAEEEAEYSRILEAQKQRSEQLKRRPRRSTPLGERKREQQPSEANPGKRLGQARKEGAKAADEGGDDAAHEEL